jgi:hypothetical protein
MVGFFLSRPVLRYEDYNKPKSRKLDGVDMYISNTLQSNAVPVMFKVEFKCLASRLHDLHDRFKYDVCYPIYPRNRGHTGTWVHAD